jgi:hypothetical protein
MNVIAIDPALLETSVLCLPNVRHLRHRAEEAVQEDEMEVTPEAVLEFTQKTVGAEVSHAGGPEVTGEAAPGSLLSRMALELSGTRWQQKYR